MKAFLTAFISLVGIFVPCGLGRLNYFAARAWQMESKGDAAGRANLQHAAQTGGWTPAAYAQFLDRHRDPAAREAYEKVARRAGEQRQLAARRMVILDLLAGDRSRPAGRGTIPERRRPRLQASCCSPRRREKPQTIPIPGPLRSFARMAALLPKPGRRSCCPRWPATWSPTAISRRQQRGVGADRIPEAGGPLSVAGARARKAGRRRRK